MMQAEQHAVDLHNTRSIDNTLCTGVSVGAQVPEALPLLALGAHDHEGVWIVWQLADTVPAEQCTTDFSFPLAWHSRPAKW